MAIAGLSCVFSENGKLCVVSVQLMFKGRSFDTSPAIAEITCTFVWKANDLIACDPGKVRPALGEGLVLDRISRLPEVSVPAITELMFIVAYKQ